MDEDPVGTTYNEACASVYDQWFSGFEPAAVDALVELARGGRVLELGIGVGLKVSQHDPVLQKIKSQHVVFQQGEVRLFPVEIRYAWPAELDLMAELAGLRLRQRWSGWDGAPFTASSAKHVSIYERPA